MAGGKSPKGRRGTHLNDEVLSSYIDGTLSPRERTAVERHVTQCAECARDLDTLQQTVLLLKDLPQVKAPRAFTLTEADVAPERARQRPLFGFLRSATVAAAMLLAVVTTGDVLMQRGIAPMPAVFEGGAMSEQAIEREIDTASPAPIAKMMVEATQLPPDAQPAQAMQMVEKEVEVEKETVVEKAAVQVAEVDVAVTAEAENTVAGQEESADAASEAPVMELAAVESDDVTEEAPLPPTLSSSERITEAPAPALEPGEGGGEGLGMGIGGGIAEEPAEESKSAEWVEETVTPAVLRPTETPTATPTPDPTIVPTLEPSRSLEPTAQVAPPTPITTVVAEARASAEPAQSKGNYGAQRAGRLEISLIRLLEIALLLIVLALVSATIASRQRRS